MTQLNHLFVQTRLRLSLGEGEWSAVVGVEGVKDGSLLLLLFIKTGVDGLLGIDVLDLEGTVQNACRK